MLQGVGASFLHVDIGNLITWGLVVLGWYTAYVRQNQLNADRFDTINRWIELHERESGERDKLLQQLVIVTTKTERAAEAMDRLTALAESRIQRLEGMYFFPGFRPPPPTPEK